MKSINYPEINHEVVVIKRENEIIFATPNGEEIASVKACTMIGEKQEKDGKFVDVPTKNFWLQFIPTDKTYDACMTDCAAVFVD